MTMHFPFSAAAIRQHLYASVLAEEGATQAFLEPKIDSLYREIGNLPFDIRRDLGRQLFCDVKWELFVHPRTFDERVPENETSIAILGLAGLLKTQELDPDYKEHTDAARWILFEKLKDGIDIPWLVANWGGYSNTKREDELKRAAYTQDDVFSHPDFHFMPARKYGFGHTPARPRRAFQRNGLIYLDGSSDLYWESPGTKFKEMLHENTHNHQMQLVGALINGSIPKSSFFFRQAVLYYDFFTAVTEYGRIYVSNKEGTVVHTAHPLEREARQNTDAAEYVTKEDISYTLSKVRQDAGRQSREPPRTPAPR